MLVRSCFLITLIKCLKEHKSLCNVKSKSTVTQWLSQSVSQWQGHLLSCSGQQKHQTSNMGEPRDQVLWLLRWNPEPCSSSSQVQWFSQVEVLCELETFGFPILPTPVLVFTFGCCVTSEEYFNQSWHLQSQRIKYLVWVQSNKSRTLHYKQQPRQLILNIMPLVDIYYSSVAGWQMLRERRSHPAFNKSYFAFVELSTKAILLS